MRWLILILLAASAGCASPEAVQVFHGDESFTGPERAAIERGNTWLAEQIGSEPLDIVWDLPHPQIIASAGPLSIARGTTDPTVLGGADHVTKRIELGAYGRLDLLAAVAAHEIGHARGLHHHIGAGLMRADVEPVYVDVPVLLVWTAADQTQCRIDGVCE